MNRRMKGSMKQGRAFYQSKGWTRKRARILRRDHYQCQEAKRYGEYREAVTVHHIFPLSEYPELALESWNLISLSNEYHNRMHDRNTGKITSEGLYWQRKRRKQFEEFKERHPPTLPESKIIRGESGERTPSNSAGF